MLLPADSIIARAKLTKYLLVRQAKRDKSAWLRRAGYVLDNADLLERDVRAQLLPNPAILTRQDKYGSFYAVDGSLTGPNGTKLHVRSIWLFPRLSDRCSFVTLYPRRRL